MSDWLQEQVRRNHLTFAQAEAARLWASDILELNAELRHNRMDREYRSAAPSDMGRVFIVRRVDRAKAALGGAGSPTYQVAYGVAVEGFTAGEMAEKLGVRTTTAMDLLRLALRAVAVVYQLHETSLTA